MTKTIYIMRGLPGSGKSYTAAKLVPKENIFSTDDFWGPEYNFNIKKIGIAHKWNQKRAEDAMKQDVTPIAIDNTNTCLKEFKIYIEFAKKYGYDIILREPDSEWWQEIIETIEHGTDIEKENKICVLIKNGQHSVPKEALRRMMARWQISSNISLDISTK